MTSAEHLAILKKGVDTWNHWREENPEIQPNLSNAALDKAELAEINLNLADLSYASLRHSDLTRADLRSARLEWANLEGTALCSARLWDAKFYRNDIRKADLHDSDLRRAHMEQVDLRKSNLSRAILRDTYLYNADLQGANLQAADLRSASLFGANLQRARFNQAQLNWTNLRATKLQHADLRGADLTETDLRMANLSAAKLEGAKLTGANLRSVNLSRANLSGADLSNVSLVQTKLSGANLTGCRVYGVSAWDLDLKGAIQDTLIVTAIREKNQVSVDNLEVAQFIYLLLYNQNIRGVVDTITSKAVLILGRFTPERKVILDTLAAKLREHNLLPIIFDFDKPKSRDFTETIKTLAGMSLFVIADITNPKSTPLELQAIVPDYQIPFVPIIQEGGRPFSMFKDLGKYDWMLKPVITYKSGEILAASFKEAILDRAWAKYRALELKKTQEFETLSAEDFLKKRPLDKVP